MKRNIISLLLSLNILNRVIVLHYAKNVSNVVSDLLFQKLFMVAEEDTTEPL